MRTESLAVVAVLGVTLALRAYRTWCKRQMMTLPKAGQSAAGSAPTPISPLPAACPRGQRVAGKFFLVTGGAQGCGEGIARALAEEGASGISICDKDAAKGRDAAHLLEAETGCHVIFVHADLSGAAECSRVLEFHDAAFGRLHGLVNAAATTARGTWDETSVDQWDAIFALNVRTPFLLMQGAARLMKRDGIGGSIVNIGSVHCHGGMPKLVAYAASKAALLNLTRNFAFAQRHARIRANYIALGWLATPTEHTTMLAEGMPADWLTSVADPGHPFGRILRPSDVGALCVHLLSDSAALHTGDCFNLHEQFFGTWE